MQAANDSTNKKKLARATEYGVLESRNIENVCLGDHHFSTWYGNGAYFHANGDLELGIETHSKSSGSRRSVVSPSVDDSFWVSTLHVCEYCFKYSTDAAKMLLHRTQCLLNKPFPPVGKLMYADLKAPYLIKKVRGFRHELFCQNLSLFGKLFLDDKLVYYNVEAFDFYVLYGFDSGDDNIGGSVLRKLLKPMGFFSKEINAWEADNNLACICIFPPYQRLRLGSLLIEFLYALAAVTPGQARLGPEFPLSPFGKLTYLRFWSKRLATALISECKGTDFTLTELASMTGFRKEDILMTLEYMEVLQVAPKNDSVTVLLLNVHQWCKTNHVDGTVQADMMNPQCLLI